MVQKSRDHRATPAGGLMGVIARTTMRALQILISLVIAGLYGADLNEATKNHEKAHSAWVFAEIVAGFSIITACVYLLPFIGSYRFFAVDSVLFLFWTALFGTFGKMYIQRDCKGNSACGKMKAAVWFDLIGMLLWFISAVAGAFMFWRARHSRSMYTGRAAVV